MGDTLHVRPTQQPGPRSRPTAVIGALALALALVAGACGSDEDGSTGSSAETGTDTAPDLIGVVREDPPQVGDVTLPEEAPGADPVPFAMTAAPGELLLVYFGYTSCPDVCPTTLSDVKGTLAALGDDAASIDLAMATVDPERDTAEVLDGYLDHFLDRYHVLRTTDPAELKAAEDAFGASSSVTTGEDGAVEVSHTGTLYAVDDTGTLLIEWPFGTPRDAVISDLQVLTDRLGDDPAA